MELNLHDIALVGLAVTLSILALMGVIHAFVYAAVAAFYQAQSANKKGPHHNHLPLQGRVK
jgi:hypothetical protein